MSKVKRSAATRLAQARALFDEGRTPLNKIAALLKRTPDSFRRYRLKEGWPEWPGHGRRKSVVQNEHVDVPGGEPAEHSKNAAPAPEACGPEAEAAPEPPDPSETDGAPVDTRALSRRLEQGVQRELVGVEKRLGSVRTTTAEVNARILASLVKSLAELRRLDGWAPAKTAQSGAGASHEAETDVEEDERPSRSIAELREELAAKLERLRADRPGD